MKDDTLGTKSSYNNHSLGNYSIPILALSFGLSFTVAEHMQFGKGQGTRKLLKLTQHRRAKLRRGVALDGQGFNPGPAEGLAEFL